MASSAIEKVMQGRGGGGEEDNDDNCNAIMCKNFIVEWIEMPCHELWMHAMWAECTSNLISN